MNVPLFILAVVSYYGVNAQEPVNLIPNGDFEDYSECPSILSELNLALPWNTPTGGSPDYFNTCGEPIVSVPANNFGDQEAYNGSGYAGFISVPSNNFSDFREYLHVELVTPMEVGKTYVVKFWYSLADNMRLAADGLHVLLTTSFGFRPGGSVIARTPQLSISSENTLDEKEEWELFAESFTADSSYAYINIGNFNDGPNTDTIQLTNGTLNQAYYYIDAVSITEIIPATKNDSNLYLPNAFTPDSDGINDVFSLSSGITFKAGAYRLSIFNRWGQKLFETDDPSKGWNGKANGKIVESGIYSVLIDGETTGGEVYKAYHRLSVLK